MPKRRRSFLGGASVVLLVLGCSGDDGGTGPLPPEFMQKTRGDGQAGSPGQTLPEPLEVKVTDGGGGAISGFTVSFSTTSGTVNPQSMSTNSQGLARTALTLPNQGATVTVTAVGAGVPSVTFTAESVPDPLTVTTPFLPAARRGMPYVRSLGASGGVGSSYTFSVVSGSLPAGLTLGTNGSFTGTPTENGAFPVTVRVSDGQLEGSMPFTLHVCEPPAAMDVGEVRVFDPSDRGSCGVFLPSGDGGDRYRVTVVRTDTTNNVDVGFLMRGNGVTGGAPPSAVRAQASSVQRPAMARGFARHLRMLEATSRTHAQLLEEGEALARRLGGQGLLRSRPPALRIQQADPLPDKLQLDPGTPGNCTASPLVTALKIAEDDHLAVYQDSAQNAAPSTRVPPAQAERLLELYGEYGKPVIDAYFGGVPDIDENGRVILFVTPATGGQTLGRVYTGDFYSKQSCGASNEGEYIYLNHEAVRTIADEGPQFGFHVVVHEMKHVSSLYERIQRNPSQPTLHPLWEEEGGAEIAAERAGRYAWSQMGGPGMGVAVTEDHWRISGGGVDLHTENYPVLFMLFRTQETLSRQPNSIVANVPGGPSDYVYGSGWLFLRWLGDAYGGAGAGALGDASLFRQLNDRATASGIPGIEALTGKGSGGWRDLMEEFARAAMANGQDVQIPRGYTSYDFVSAIEMWCFALDPKDAPNDGCRDENGQPLEAGAPGAFPWTVTTDAQGLSESRSFADANFEGSVGPSGIRVHEFVSNGSGHGAEINVEVASPGKVVVLRLR